MANLAERIKSKDKKYFIAIEMAIYEGVMKVAKADSFPIIPFKDSFEDLKDLNIKFLNLTQDKDDVQKKSTNDDKPEKFNLLSSKNELFYHQLERDSKLAINVWCIDMKKRAFCLGSAAITLFSEEGFLKQKNQDIYLWPLERYNEDLICFGMNRIGAEKMRPTLRLRLINHGEPVKLGKITDFLQAKPNNKDGIEIPSEDNRYTHILDNIKENKKKRIEYYNKLTEADDDNESFLPLFMKSSSHKAEDDTNMQKDWESIDPNTALGLLQSSKNYNITFSTKFIREKAVAKINTLSNRALADYMPQLVQALKSEPFHKSNLGEVLLKRALESPRVVGHAYFWAINASLYDKFSFERLYLHYERFICLCHDYRKELFFQSKVNDIVQWIASKTHDHKNEKEKHDLEDRLLLEMQEEIQKLKNHLEFDFFILPHIPDTPFQNIYGIDILTV